jgi:hypothetical protein
MAEATWDTWFAGWRQARKPLSRRSFDFVAERMREYFKLVSCPSFLTENG